MSGVSRRTFMTHGSLAVAVGSVAAVAPGIGSILEATPADAAERERALNAAEVGAVESQGPLVAHVSDIRTGEISIYQGETQVVYKDKGLAARLARAASRRGR